MQAPGLAPGDVIDGRYVVEAELGRGGYGVVWRVRHQRLDALRAVKVLHDPDPEVAERLREEGQVLARLEHPHVVRVHDLVELGSGLALVMELVDGPTLAERLQGGPVSLDEVECIGRGLLEGLQAAHRQGVLHRDLKPGNLLLASGADGVVPKLVDFGLAVPTGSAGREAAGTPAYMAPEQLEGRFDERSDVFAAATVLYELATGHRAFEGRSMSHMMLAKAEGRFEHPRSHRPELPAGMAHALLQALAPRPEARTATVAELLAAWRRPTEGSLSQGGEVFTPLAEQAWRDGGDSSGVVLGGRFELRGVLGTGGMSTVHRAWDRLTDSEVALKLLAIDFARDADFRERFKREAQRMRQLDHPHVLSSVELGSLDSGQLWLSMPVLGGGTLRERLSQGPPTVEEADRWARQLLSALVALAEAGVVHRDVKPSNLLLDDDGALMLVDFGVALSEDDARLTRTLQQMGSLAYLAPECRGAGDATDKSDVYSAALVIHELYTGRAAGALPGKGVDGVVGSCLRRMGAVDPDERPTAAEVLSALADPVQPEAAEAVAVGATDRRLLALGVPLGAAAGVLWGLPAWVVVAQQLAPDRIPSGMLVSRVGEGPHVWAGAALAVGLPLLAGLGLPSRGHGALAGAVVALVAFAVGGGQLALLAGAEPVYAALAAGPADVPTVLGDTLVRLAWLLLGGSLVATVLGAGLGAAGAAVRSGRGVPTPPDPFLRQLAGAGVVVMSTSTALTWPALDSMLTQVHESAGAAVGLDVTLGVVSWLATVPWMVGQAVGLWLCASPRVPVVRGETALRLALLVLVVGCQLVVVDLTTWVPPLVSAGLLLGVLAWRRPWARVAEPAAPRDVMAVASAGLAAIAVASVGMPLAHLGLSMESTLIWSLPALQGLTDAVPAAARVDAQLQHHFAFTRLVLASCALVSLAAATGWVAVVSGWLALRRELPDPAESLRAVGLGSLIVAMMVFGTGHDLFETSRADPRLAVPDAPEAGLQVPWRLWVQGDLLHAVLPSPDTEGERLIAATSAHLRGRPGIDLGPSEREQALGAALQGEPGLLHAWLTAHDDPLLSTLHHAVGAVPWGDDPHDDLQPVLPVEWLLAARRAGSVAEREAAWAAYEAAAGARAPLWLERADRGDSTAREEALQQAPGRLDVHVAAAVDAIRRHDPAAEATHREALGLGTPRVAREVDHVLALAEAYVAGGRLREARDLLVDEIKRGSEAEGARLIGGGVALLGRPGLGAEALVADLGRLGQAELPAPGPCDAALERALSVAPAEGLALVASGACPPTAGVAVWEALLRAALWRQAGPGEGEVHRTWLRDRWRGADPMPASQGLFDAR